MNLELSESTKVGMARAKAEGIKVGRPRKGKLAIRHAGQILLLLTKIEELKKENKELKLQLGFYTLPGNGKRSVRNKDLIMARDKHQCRICGSKELLEYHHLKPWSQGGDNSSQNIIVLCSACHLFMHCNPQFIALQKKNHKTATQAGMEKARNNGAKIGRPKGVRSLPIPL